MRVFPLALMALAFPATALAFAPTHLNESQGFKDEIGPPARNHVDHATTQKSMGESNLPWQLFKAAHPTWTVRWDEFTGTPLRMMGAGLDLGLVDTDQKAALSAQLFLPELENLMGVSSEDLQLVANVQRGDQRFVIFQRTVAGIPVEGALVQLRFKFGKLVMLALESHPGASAVSTHPKINQTSALQQASRRISANNTVVERGNLVILPTNGVEGLSYALTYRSRIDVNGQSPAQYYTYVDATTGAIVHRYNDIRHGHKGTITGGHEARTIGDEVIVSPLVDAYVGVSKFQRTLTDVNGNYNYSGRNVSELDSALVGPWVMVQDSSSGLPTETFMTSGAVGNDFDWGYGDYAAKSATNTFHHTTVVRDRALLITPDLPELQNRMMVNVEINDACNAFYNGRSINFFQDDEQCNNTGRIADVVYHEYGHHYHHILVVSGVTDGAIGEGSGDYLAATITGDPLMAPGFFKNGGAIRDLEPNLSYPDDLVGEVHTDGLIWAGAMWDLRKHLILEMGETEGIATSDTLFADTLMGGPKLSTVYEEILIADDDDGDLSNGTPNLCLISEEFGRHGLGPGVLASFDFNEKPAAEAGEALPLQVGINSSYDQCLTLNTESAQVRWSTSPDGPFNSLSMTLNDSGSYQGFIPPQAAGTLIYYAFDIDDEQGNTHSTDSGKSYALYQTMFGNLTEVVCEDFNNNDGGYTHALIDGEVSEGADDWMWGLSQGAFGDPVSEDFIWGNDLAPEGFNGAYQADKVNALTSPVYDTQGIEGVFLRYRRWLNVEDGLNDQATIYVSGQAIWQNEASQDGLTNHEDRRWVWHYVALNGLADDSNSVDISFELATNNTREFGGWNIDDVCLFTLD